VKKANTFFFASSSSLCFWKGVFFRVIEKELIFASISKKPVYRNAPKKSKYASKQSLMFQASQTHIL
jgi:hypothetical protein